MTRHAWRHNAVRWINIGVSSDSNLMKNSHDFNPLHVFDYNAFRIKITGTLPWLNELKGSFPRLSQNYEVRWKIM